MRFVLLIAFVLLIVISDQLTAVTCKDRVAQAPIAVRDPLYGRKLLEKARATIMASERLKCDPFIDVEETVRWFDYVGMSFFFGKKVRNLKSKQIESLSKETDASLFMFTATDGETLVAETYRALQVDGDYVLVRVKRYQATLGADITGASHTPIYLRYLALMAPNSFTLGTTFTEVSMDLEEGYTEENTENHGVIPQFISSMSVSKVEHSDGFGMFDVGGSIFPGTFFFAIDQETRIRKKDDATAEPIYLHVQVFGACSNFNALGTLFSAVGATYASVGLGPCLYRNKIEDKRPKTYFNLATRFVFGHRVFLSKRIFTFLEVDMLTFSNKIYRSELADSYQISRGTLGLGWYVPDVESLFIRTVAPRVR